MKFAYLTFILLLTYSIFIASAIADTNLVVNPGFENGSTTPMNWRLMSQNGNTPIWDNVSHNGSKSIKISIPATTNTISGYPISDLITVQPFTNYTVSAWCKTNNADGTNKPAVRVVEIDANKNFLLQTNLPVFTTGTNDWTEKKLEFKTRSDTRYIYVYANIWNGYGTFWVDDITISLKTSTSTPTLTITPTPTVTSTPTLPPTVTSIPTPTPTKKLPGFGIVLVFVGLMGVVLRKRI